MFKTIKIEASADELARAFCELDALEQVKFFAECHKINKEWQAEYEAKSKHLRGIFISGGQWYAIGSEALKQGINSEAAEVLMEISAPLYIHTLEYVRART